MTQFTQLNLNQKSGNSSLKQSTNSGRRRHFVPHTRAVMFIGLLTIATVSGAALLALNGCSKKQPAKSEIMPPTQPTMPSSTALNPISTAQSQTPPPKPVKKPRKSSPVTYVNRTYGLSLQYPRRYSLKTGDDAQLELNGSPLPMDFVKPGGISVAALEMPRNMYPGTDLNSAFLMVNVNPNLSASECDFVVPRTPGSDTEPTIDGKRVSDSKATEKVKIGGREFTQEDKSEAELTKQSEARYYHVFEHGACYEFALALGTGLKGAENETKPVDRDAVFAKLEKILATVKIKSPDLSNESTKQEVGGSSQDSSFVQPTNLGASSTRTVEQQKFEPTPVHPE